MGWVENLLELGVRVNFRVTARIKKYRTTRFLLAGKTIVSYLTGLRPKAAQGWSISYHVVHGMVYMKEGRAKGMIGSGKIVKGRIYLPVNVAELLGVADRDEAEVELIAADYNGDKVVFIVPKAGSHEGEGLQAP